VAKAGLDKIVVRRIGPQDRSLLRRWLEDPQIGAAIQDETIDLSRPQEAIALFEGSDAFRDGALGLLVEAGGQAVGLIHFACINWINRNAEVITFIGPGELRCSLMAAVLMERIGHIAFRILNLHKVYAFVYANNHAALAAFRKVMQEEARLRNYVRLPQGYMDFHLFGMLATEYFAAVRRLDRSGSCG